MSAITPLGERQGKASTAALTVRAIDLIASAANGLTLTTLAEQLQMPKSSAHRLLTDLVAEQVLMRRDADKTYRLAPRWSALGQDGGPRDLVRSFLEVAGDVAATLEETIQLAVRSGDRVTFVAFVDSPRLVRLTCRVGRQVPVHVSASGKVLLAWETPENVDDILNSPLIRLTEHTVTDPEVLRQQLVTARRTGYATESQESMRGLSCISVPIRSDGQVIAAFTACLPMPSLPAGEIDRVLPVITAAADALQPTEEQHAS